MTTLEQIPAVDVLALDDRQVARDVGDRVSLGRLPRAQAEEVRAAFRMEQHCLAVHECIASAEPSERVDDAGRAVGPDVVVRGDEADARAVDLRDDAVAWNFSSCTPSPSGGTPLSLG